VTRMPRTAMLLAAGLATRMRPLTDRTAKPLLPLGGKALIDHALDRLAETGVETVVVNAHWHADQLEAHLRARSDMPPHTIIRYEASLLDTGGSVKAALDLLGSEPFFVVNGDAFWLDGTRTALSRLANQFDEQTVDAILLVHRTFQVHAEVGFGDFLVDKWGRVQRRGERDIAPYIYAGLQLISPALLRGMPDGPFSMNRAWDVAVTSDRLRAVVHDGLWFHLSTPDDLAEAETVLQARLTGETR
jgi:N-acetyl-alpha-D-muramate 1-phosphate uridylyltransferase